MASTIPKTWKLIVKNMKNFPAPIHFNVYSAQKLRLAQLFWNDILWTHIRTGLNVNFVAEEPKLNLQSNYISKGFTIVRGKTMSFLSSVSVSDMDSRTVRSAYLLIVNVYSILMFAELLPNVGFACLVSTRMRNCDVIRWTLTRKSYILVLTLTVMHISGPKPI